MGSQVKSLRKTTSLINWSSQDQINVSQEQIHSIEQWFCKNVEKYQQSTSATPPQQRLFSHDSGIDIEENSDPVKQLSSASTEDKNNAGN